MRRFAPIAAAAAIAFAAVPAIAAADFALADWPYAKEVRTPPGPQEDLVELHPDAQLYDGSAPGADRPAHHSRGQPRNPLQAGGAPRLNRAAGRARHHP